MTATTSTTSPETPAHEAPVSMLVNVDVDDLNKGLRFYTEAFGLRPGRRFGRAAVELLGAQAPIYLLVKATGTLPFSSAEAARAYNRHWTPVHLDFAVEDLEAAVRRALDAGATTEGPISEHAWGRMAFLSDPFGHGICLLQFTGRGYDEVATRR
jgi:predicted enzyme related to lactoylglutathione lyase